MKPTSLKLRNISAGKLLLGTLLSSLALAACMSSPSKKQTEVSSASAPGNFDSVSTGGEASAHYGEVAGKDVFGGKGLPAFEVHGVKARARRSVVDVQGQPFKQAIRMQILAKSENIWDVQLGATTTVAIEQGDVLLASFYLRTEATATAVGQAETGEGQTEVAFELNHPPHEKSATYSAKAGSEWRQIFVPFVAKSDLAAGEAQIVFRLGYAAQTLDFADLKVENFGNKLELTALPKTRTTYEGHEQNASWRGPAQARIDKLRRAELTVEVVDAEGKPVLGASVHAELTRHEFLFGTCAPADHLLDAGKPKYNGYVSELFNAITLENDLKWQPLDGDWEEGFTLERAGNAVDWAVDRNLFVRGHVLVWPGWQNLPKRIKGLEKDPAKLRSETVAHIRQLVTAMKGRLDHWDVVNEPFTNHELIDILGNEEMIEWFKLAHKLDPKPKLFINDFAILNGGGGTTEHRDHYEKMIKLLVDGDAPLDGVGLQAHFGTALTSPDDLYGLLDRYSKYGQELAITEYDIVMDDEQLAGDYTRDFYTTLFSHPAVKTIVMWGFWDHNHWKKNAAMYRDDWSLKPAGKVYRDLVLGEWHTDETGKTSTDGKFTTRGFKGQYRVDVKTTSGAKTVKAILNGAATRLVVQL